MSNPSYKILREMTVNWYICSSYTFTELQTPLYTGSKGQCISSLASGQKFIYYTASAGSTGPWTLSTSIWGTPSTQTGSVHAVPINGYVFVTTSATGMSSTIGPAKETTTSNNGNVGVSKGLSSGEKVGIGVGAALIVLLLITIGLGTFWFMRTRKRSRKTELGSRMDGNDGYAMRMGMGAGVTDHYTAERSPDPQKHNSSGGMGAEVVVVGGAKPELEALRNQRHEMDGVREVVVQELDGGGVGRRAG